MKMKQKKNTKQYCSHEILQISYYLNLKKKLEKTKTRQKTIKN